MRLRFLHRARTPSGGPSSRSTHPRTLAPRSPQASPSLAPFYVPVSRLDLIHGWARANAADGLRPAANVFQASWTSSIGVQYYEGVASLASVRRAPAPRARAHRRHRSPAPAAQAYFVIGVLLFIFFAIVNLSAVFCRARVEKRVRRPTCCARCATIVFAPSYWYLGGVALMGVLTAVAIAQAVQFKTTVRARPSSPRTPPQRRARSSLTLSLPPSLARLRTLFHHRKRR